MNKKKKSMKDLKGMTPEEMLEEIEKNPELKDEVYKEMSKTPEFQKQFAQQFASPIVQASNTYLAYKHKEEFLEYEEIVIELELQTKALRSNDMSRVEDILMAQAQTLDLLFHKQARKASAQQYLNQFKVHMDIFLMARRQSRSTLEALAEIKNPKPYIQNNRAQYQQVNNGVSESHARGENIKSSNELLEDKTHEQEWMDTGTPETAGGDDKELETVGTKHRSKN
jgi:hypothetical protein